MRPSVATSCRFVVALAIFAAVLAASSAHAATVTITNTYASAGCISQNSQGPLAASCSAANAGGTANAAALANVLAGHLGASAFSSIPGTAWGAGSYFLVGLSVQGGEPGDALLFTLKLDGSYSFGGGGNVQLIYDTVGDQGEVINNAVVSCNTYDDINHGTSCWQAPDNSGPGAAGNSTSFLLYLNGIDNIGLTCMLNVSTGPNATPGAGVSADFMNSAHLTITVPNGITLNNFSGGDLFQQPTSPAPEPASLLLLGAGILGLASLRRRRS